MHTFPRKIALLGVALTLSGAAVAREPSADAAKKKAADPNEVVCEKQEALGSRLSVKRVCMTRAEWAEQRLQDRQAIDQAQTRRGAKGE